MTDNEVLAASQKELKEERAKSKKLEEKLVMILGVASTAALL